MSKTKELLMQMYERYDSLEGSCDDLREYYHNLEEQYYGRKKDNKTT